MEKSVMSSSMYRKMADRVVARSQKTAREEVNKDKMQVGDKTYYVGDEVMYNNKPTKIKRIYDLDSDQFGKMEKMELANGVVTHPGLDPRWGGTPEEWEESGGEAGTEQRYKDLQKYVGKRSRRSRKVRAGEYPELDEVAIRIADSVAKEINKVAPGIESEMPYKAQYILEEVIKDLQERV